MKIYTRTGDLGTTSLVGGTRVSKTDTRLEAYGTIDELNAHLGLLHSLLTDDADRSFVIAIQTRLFSLGAELATDVKSQANTTPSLSTDEVTQIEREIDRIDALLQPLHTFILPGGCQTSSQCHICRTICRRAERRILTLAAEAPVSPDLIRYVNRLSDYFFVLARKVNQDGGIDEIFWQNSCK